MVTRRLGYRRLFAAVGYAVEEEFPFFSMRFGDLEAHIYFGPQPKLDAVLFAHQRYLLDSEELSLQFFQADAVHVVNDAAPFDALQVADDSSQFWVDVICWKEVEVNEEMLAEPQRLLVLTEQHEPTLAAAVDAIAGTIGLLVSPRLVARMAAENFIFRNDDAPDQNVILDRSGWYTQTQPHVLARPELEELAKRLWAVGQTNMPLLQQGAVPLGWLLRGRADQTSVFEFMALFIALEVVANWYDPDNEDQQRQKKRTQAARQIRRLIKQHGGTHQADLLTYLDEVQNRDKPSLVSRFAAMAKKAQMPGWEQDIDAFSRFNRLRNDIVHAGQQRVSFFVKVSSDEVRELEELASRYTRYALQDMSAAS